MKLSARESGDAKGLPVVLLHAFPMSSAMWEPQLAALKRFRVLTPDLRGFGGTPLVAPWFIENAVDDLLETLSAAGVERAALVGLSMGGYVALRAAQKAPERVLALALCDTRAEADGNEAKLKRAAAVEFVRARGTASFVRPFLKDALAPGAEGSSAFEFLRGVAESAAPESVMAALAALAARADMTEVLPKIAVATCVLVGAHDKITPLSAAELLRSRIPGASLRVIPGAGHFSSAENPAAFNETLVSFLSGL